MAGDARLTGLARILGLDPADLDPTTARVAIRERADELAAAFFAEAAENDDVTGPGTARDYLALRLAGLGDLILPEAAAAIRAGFEQRLRAWE